MADFGTSCFKLCLCDMCSYSDGQDAIVFFCLFVCLCITVRVDKISSYIASTRQVQHILIAINANPCCVQWYKFRMSINSTEQACSGDMVKQNYPKIACMVSPLLKTPARCTFITLCRQCEHKLCSTMHVGVVAIKLMQCSRSIQCNNWQFAGAVEEGQIFIFFFIYNNSA